MPRRPALIASTLAVAVLLVGCGSDDDASDDERETTTTVEETTTTTTGSDEEPSSETTAPEETTTTAAEEPSTTAGEGGDGTGDPEFCATYGAFDEDFQELPQETLEDIQAGFAALDAALDDLQEVAPEELAEDLVLLAEAGDQVVAAAADATTAEEAMEATTEIFSDEEVSTAAERIDVYFRERCPEANDDQAPSDDGVEPPTTEG